MQQSLHERYTLLRRRYLSAHLALATARISDKRLSSSEPHIGPSFPFHRYANATPPSTHYRWIEHISHLGWRTVGFADEILNLRHKGWYADSHADLVYRGIVYRLPGMRFLSGYADPINRDCALLSNGISHDERDAARSADRIAELFAERDRDYDEAWHTIRTALDQTQQTRTECREALADLRDLEICDSPRIRKTIRNTFDHAWSRYRSACTALRDSLEDCAGYGIKISDF